VKREDNLLPESTSDALTLAGRLPSARDDEMLLTHAMHGTDDTYGKSYMLC